MDTSNEIVQAQPSNQVAIGEHFRQSSVVASLTAEIVKRTAKPVQGKKFVSVEGWQAIAIAHGCVASSMDVEPVPGGVRAIGVVRRMSDGLEISRAEGFVGEDEVIWFGGERWVYEKGQRILRQYPKREMFAIRAMAQTRAISRACRSAFAHVVVMIDENLGTTPAEEIEGLAAHLPEPPSPKAKALPPNSKEQQPASSAATDPERAKVNRELFAAMTAKGVGTDKDTRCRLASTFFNRDVRSFGELTVDELRTLAQYVRDTAPEQLNRDTIDFQE